MTTFFFLISFAISLSEASPVSGFSYDTSLTSSVDKTVLLKLVNDARKRGCQCGDKYYPSAPALVWNDKLEKAALSHSMDMYENRYFNHRNKEGQSSGDRMKAAGYKYAASGENIAHGYADEKAVVEGWLSSPGHCANIMTSYFQDIGVGKSGSYWTMDLATK